MAVAENVKVNLISWDGWKKPHNVEKMEFCFLMRSSEDAK